ncbi:ATP-dependent sacrificial sulfur transferase LarE [bacterium]|nr:ATP-dependent sacrificial sulfur transferase LarE [bacterium]
MTDNFKKENEIVAGKFNKLKEILKSMGSVLIAFSGGVDSSFLLKTADDVLKEKVLAVTAKSSTFPEREIKKAIEIAQILKVRHLVIESNEMKNPDYLKNDLNRCYYCKTELFEDLKKIALNEGLNFVLDGQNYDDIGDYRPGMRAAAEIGVRSPLKESCLTKNDIRRLSKKLGLPNWDSPSLACLSSRIPYGTEIDKGLLARIDFLENFLLDLGFTQVRVRHHDKIARIEIPEEEMNKFNARDIRMRIINEFKNQGYLYITLDLEGYKTGSMNKVLKEN